MSPLHRLAGAVGLAVAALAIGGCAVPLRTEADLYGHSTCDMARVDYIERVARISGMAVQWVACPRYIPRRELLGPDADNAA
jgi:hypothetical protein